MCIPVGTSVANYKLQSALTFTQCHIAEGAIIYLNQYKRYLLVLLAGRFGFESLQGTRNYSLLQNVQTDSGVHPAFSDPFLGIKRPKRDIDPSLHLAPSLRMSGDIPVLPLHVVMA